MRSDRPRDLFLHQVTAADYLAAADAARRNPHETPAACEARARYYEAKARELTTTERTP